MERMESGLPIKVHRVQKYFFLLMAGVPLARFSPQTNPVDTAPIPANARILDEPCSSTGIIVCGVVSVLSGDTSAERRSACIVYIEPGGGGLNSAARFLRPIPNNTSYIVSSKPDWRDLVLGGPYE
jgi:hypothetical protein